jgi:hypothetical protein
MVLLSGSAALAISACGGSEPPMVPAAQVVPAYSPRDAAEIMAAARCDREQRCNNVGPSREYQNREHCMHVFRTDAANELTKDEDCARGIKSEDLSECSSQLRGRSCSTVGGAFESLGSSMSCSSGELCMD